MKPLPDARSCCVRVFLCVVICFCASVGCGPFLLGGKGVPSWVPPAYRERVSRAIELSGENREEVERALQGAMPENREAVAFLLAYMPAVDLAYIEGSMLLENVNLALRARSLFPWGKKIPDDIFRHYVIPHRVTQEPLEDWRPYLLKDLTPVVENEPSLARAAIAVNKWCGERVKFGYTQWRDQGPFETLRSGYGRCEEMTILLICALRSVSIPARIASTPRWSTLDGNHAWTEVWVDGDWKYIGSCEPAEELSRTWFSEAVKRVAVVYSLPYGIPEDSGDFYKTGSDYAIINSTNAYTEPGRIRMKVIVDNRPSPEEPVSVSVFNSGALRPVGLLKTGAEGVAELVIGAGTYFVAAGRDRASWEVCRVESHHTSEILLDLSESEGFNSEFWLRYQPLEFYK